MNTTTATPTPEALAIAVIFKDFAIDHTPDGWPAVKQMHLSAAAAELERQHAEIEALRALLSKKPIIGSGQTQYDRLIKAARNIEQSVNSSSSWGRIGPDDSDIAWQEFKSLTSDVCTLIDSPPDNEALKAERARSGLEHRKAVQEAVSEAVAAEREMTETQRAAMQAAHDAIALAQNNLAASRESAIAFDDGDLWDQYQRAMDGITAALAEPEPADAPAGYTTSPITWKSPRHHSEQIVKITQRQQPEYGFTHAVFNAPQRREPLTDAEWLDYVLRHGTKTDVHIATYEGIATVGPMGKVIRLQTDANNLRKLVEKAHGIGAKP